MNINNLFVTYDSDGTVHYWAGDRELESLRELTKDQWMQQHPLLRREAAEDGNGKGRGRNAIGGNLRERYKRFTQRNTEAEGTEAE